MSERVTSSAAQFSGSGLARVLLGDEDDFTAPPAPGTGVKLPGHDLLEEIARGGMGVVYKARQHSPDRTVAVKMLAPNVSWSVHRERFLLEARTLAELDHPGLLPVYQSGEAGGVPYFTMKLARGSSLAERRAALTGKWREIAAVMAEVAEAVAFAHEHGVLHRDIKPGNVLFDTDGTTGAERAYVADFGLAKLASEASDLTRSVAMLGTPHYVSPEVAERGAAAATVASDVYALGAVLYELLAQRRPFEAESIPALLRAVCESDPAPLPAQVPRDLAIIARQTLAKNPQHRYATARALADDLHAWLHGAPITARPATLRENFARWLRRHPALAASLALVIAGVTAFVFIQARSARELRAERDIAQSARGDALAREAAAARASGRADLRNGGLAAAKAAAAFKVTPELRDDAITLLAMPGMEPLPVLDGGKCEIVPLCPDHDVLVKREEKHIVLHNVRDPSQPPQRSPDLTGRIASVAYISPQAGLVAVRCHDSSHHLYDRAQNRWVRSWMQPCWGFAVSPSGKRLAWGRDGSGEVVIEDLLTGAQQLAFTTPRRQAVPRAFSPDGKLLAVSGFKRSNVWDSGLAVIDTQTGGLKHDLACDLLETQMADVSWRPDSRALALNQGTSDFICHTFDGLPMRERIIGHTAEGEAVAWHPGGRWLFTAAFDGSVRLWELPWRREVLRLPLLMESVQFSRDGTELAGLEWGGGKLYRFRFQAPASLVQMPLPRNSGDHNRQRPPWACALSPDGRLGISASDAGLHWFDAVKGERLGWQGIGYTLGLIFNPAGDTVYATSSTGLWRIPLKRTGLAGYEAVLAANIPRPQLPGQFLRVAISEDNRRIACTSMDGPGIVQLPDFTRRLLPAPFPLNPCTLSPDGRWMVASGGDEAPEQCGLAFYDLEKPEAPPRILPEFSRYTYTCFSPDSRCLFVHTRGFQTALAAGTWERIWTHDRRSEPDTQHMITVSGDGTLLAAVEPGGAIGLYDPRDGRRLALLTHPVASWNGWLGLDHTGSRLIWPTLPDSVIIWDLRKLREELTALGLDWDMPPYPPAPGHGRFTLRFVPEALVK